MNTGKKLLICLYGVLVVLCITLSLIWTYHPKFIVIRSLVTMFDHKGFSTTRVLYDDYISDENGYKAGFTLNVSNEERFGNYTGAFSFPKYKDVGSGGGFYLWNEQKSDDTNINLRYQDDTVSLALNDRQYSVLFDDTIFQRVTQSAIYSMLFKGEAEKLSDVKSFLPKEKFSFGWFDEVPVRPKFDFTYILNQVVNTKVTKNETTLSGEYFENDTPVISYELSLNTDTIAYFVDLFGGYSIISLICNDNFTYASGAVYIDKKTDNPVGLYATAVDNDNNPWELTFICSSFSNKTQKESQVYHIYIRNKNWADHLYFYIMTDAFYDHKTMESVKHETYSVIDGKTKTTYFSFLHIYDMKNKTARYEFSTIKDLKLVADYKNNRFDFSLSALEFKSILGKDTFEGNLILSTDSSEMTYQFKEKGIDILTNSKLKLMIEAVYLSNFFKNIGGTK